MVISHQQQRRHQAASARLTQARRRIADVMLGDRSDCQSPGKVATWKSVLIVLWIAAVTASTLVLYWPAWHVSLN